MKELLNGTWQQALILTKWQCHQAKAVHQSFPKELTMRAEKPGDLTHSDLWGLAPKASPGGSKYFISFIDNKTRHITIKFIKSKLDAECKIQNYVVWIKLNWDKH